RRVRARRDSGLPAPARARRPIRGRPGGDGDTRPHPALLAPGPGVRRLRPPARLRLLLPGGHRRRDRPGGRLCRAGDELLAGRDDEPDLPRQHRVGAGGLRLRLPAGSHRPPRGARTDAHGLDRHEPAGGARHRPRALLGGGRTGGPLHGIIAVGGQGDGRPARAGAAHRGVLRDVGAGDARGRDRRPADLRGGDLGDRRQPSAGDPGDGLVLRRGAAGAAANRHRKGPGRRPRLRGLKPGTAPGPEGGDMDDEAIGYLGASELVAAYASGSLAPTEVTAAILRRIEAVNPVINAFCLVDAEGAMGQAAASAERWRRHEPMGPLDGVPVTVKDLIDARGWPTLKGSLTIDPAGPWENDAPVVARLREAGAVIL